MLELSDIKRLHDKAYQSGQTTRERASDDLVFYWITHWDDSTLQESQLAYRGEFDILRKAGRNILADLEANPVQVNFEPVDDSKEDVGDILEGLYRADCRKNTSIEAFANADQETVVCGIGAWELYTDYESTRGGDTNQVIKRKPIYEANNTVYFDPNAKLLDKSDATYCSVLFAYSEDGYKNLVEELTGERPERVNPSNFKDPEQSYVFPWILGESKKIYVSAFYHREKVKKKILLMVNPLGQEITLDADELKSVMDDMLDAGFEIVSEKKGDRYQVTKYICSGEEILDSSVIAGEHIPIVPEYGERAYIEGEEHYEGVTRLAKDPQRLRDFQLSYLADISSRSPREKPIFQQEQIAGFEDMYSDTGAENNYPYLLQNRLTPNGEPLPIGPIGMMPSPNIPPALAATIELSRQAVEDVANPGIPQDIADPDLSGKAVLALQARMDMQSMIYQTHRKHALRRDGEIYASMAAEVYDVPREVKIELPDGTRKTEKVIETVIDNETGEIVTLKDLRNVEFNVFSDIGASYSSKKEQTLDRIETLIGQLPPGEPMRNILLLKYLKLMNGVDFEDVRDYAKDQLLMLGLRKPETPEEAHKLLQAQQQPKEQSAEMVLAQAEVLKGQAANKEADIKMFNAQVEAQNKQAKQQIDTFNAQTDRIDTQVAAQKAGADIEYKRVDTFGKQLDNQAKVIQFRQPQNMSDEELMEELYGMDEDEINYQTG
ncbi:MAG: hypothetical protein HGA87_01190 [Desulfobulbaceae bacterium]|nr:hypothetical protein [Desulfobulbaceae bacterium]